MQSAFVKSDLQKSYAESKPTDTANNRKEGNMGIIENMRLDGKAIYVTGAASGIGKCAAMAFAEAGADVAIVDINLEGAQKVADEIAEKTGASTATISRVNRSLNYGNDGYEMVFSRMAEKETKGE